MNPIISPWWIYVYEIIEALNALLAAICACTIFAVVIMIVLCIINTIEDNSNTVKTLKSWIQRVVILSVISGIIAVFVPSQDTLIYMQIARLSTPENLEQVVETTKDTVDYVINAVQSMKEDVS